MSFERLGDEAPAVNECHAGERSSFFGRSLLALALVACAAERPAPLPICPRVAEPQRAHVAAPSPDATISREVKTAQVTYVFRASRNANFVYALDCLAEVSRCSRAAYESAFTLDDADRAALRAWKALHVHYSGRISPSEETKEPAELPVTSPVVRNVSSQIRLASFGADDAPGMLERISAIVEPGDVARAQSVMARFDGRFEKLWLARRDDLEREVEGFAALAARPDVRAITESVARFYEPDLPADTRETIELLARPEREGSDSGEQLGDHALVETLPKERPEERLDVVLHELFHRWFASAPYDKKRALATAFAKSKDPFARPAYGVMNEALATAFGNGLVGRAINRADFDARLAKPLGLYHRDRFVDPTVKAMLEWIERWIRDGKTLYDPRFIEEYVAHVKQAFPSGVPPVLHLRPMVLVHEEALEEAARRFYDVVLPGSSESEVGFGRDSRALLSKRSTWGTAIVVTNAHVEAVKGLDPRVDAVLDALRKEATKKKPLVLTVTRGDASPAFVFVAPDAPLMQKLADAFAEREVTTPGIWAP